MGNLGGPQLIFRFYTNVYAGDFQVQILHDIVTLKAFIKINACLFYFFGLALQMMNLKTTLNPEKRIGPIPGKYAFIACMLYHFKARAIFRGLP